MRGKRRKLALGDSLGNYSITNPLSGQTTNHEIRPNIADPYYSSNSLNSLSTPSASATSGFGSTNVGRIFNSGTGTTQNAIGMAASALNTAISSGQEKGAVSGAVEGVANAVPLWGQLFNLTRGISGGIRGKDKTDPTRNVLANIFSPSSGVTGDLDRGQNALLSTFNPIAGGIRNAQHFQKKELEKEREENALRSRESEAILANYPIYGNGLGAGIGKYGGYLKYPNGGLLPYPTDGSHVNQLASNIAQYNGATHENGGIDLDINNDNSPEVEIENKEVIKDDMVLSNRLSPSKSVRDFAKSVGITPKKRESYASLAARIGKKKGEFETFGDGNTPAANSARLMAGRLDGMMDMLFMDQQNRKFGKVSSLNKFPGGGTLPKVKGPIYASQDPRTTIEQNEIRAINNLHLAQRFKNMVSPSGMVASSDYSNLQPELTGFQQTGGGARNYSIVDPIALQRADSVIQAGRPFLKPAPNLVTRKNGGKLPKAIDGRRLPEIGGYQPSTIVPSILDNSNPSTYNGAVVLPEVPIIGNSIPNTRSVVPTNFALPATINTNIPNTIVPRNISNPGVTASYNTRNSRNNTPFRNSDWQDYRGDLAALLGTTINQGIINRMETNYNPETVDMPLNTYTDRTGYLTSVANQGFRTATQGINNSSSQDNLALKSNLYAKSLQGLNQSLDSEFQRKDAYSARFNDLINRTKMINAGIRNQGKQISMDNRNQKRALTQANVDNLIRSYIGNEAVRDFKKSEYTKNYLNASKSGNRGVDQRTIDNLPKDVKRQLGFK